MNLKVHMGFAQISQDETDILAQDLLVFAFDLDVEDVLAGVLQLDVFNDQLDLVLRVVNVHFVLLQGVGFDLPPSRVEPDESGIWVGLDLEHPLERLVERTEHGDDRVAGELWLPYVGLVQIPQDVVQPVRLLACLLYTSPSPRDRQKSRMPSSA